MEALAHAIKLFGSISAASDKTRAKSSGQIIESTGSCSRQYRNERDKNLSGESRHATWTESGFVMVRAEPTVDEASLGRDVDNLSAATTSTKHNLAARANVVERQRFSLQSRRDARTKSAVDKTFTAFASYAATRHSYAAKFDAHIQQISGAASRLRATAAPGSADLCNAA